MRKTTLSNKAIWIREGAKGLFSTPPRGQER